MIKRENVVIFDNEGIPSIMAKFTRENNNTLFEGGTEKPHPMFVIGGEVYDEIYISKYENTLINGKPYSLPYQKPATEITNDDAARICFSKGEGWHLMTAAEWGYLALDSLRNGTLPHGNTNNGTYHADKSEKGVRYGSYHTLTGSGPKTWAHDHSEEGVHDLCGNNGEMVRGLRIKDGVLQIAENNDAALDIDLTEQSENWKDITTDMGESVKVSVDDDGISITTAEEIGQEWRGDHWKNITIDCATETLKELAIFPGEPDAYFYADASDGEYFPYRGGNCANGANAGVFALFLSPARSYSGTGFGFRSAFYRKTAN